MAMQLGFLEQGDSVLRDLESTARAGYQGDLGIGELLADLGRQTGGPGLVASNGAVFDRDLHEVSTFQVVHSQYSASIERDECHIGLDGDLAVESWPCRLPGS
jgi:hypothetical protein